jgi:hypothetical protein
MRLLGRVRPKIIADRMMAESLLIHGAMFSREVVAVRPARLL